MENTKWKIWILNICRCGRSKSKKAMFKWTLTPSHSQTNQSAALLLYLFYKCFVCIHSVIVAFNRCSRVNCWQLGIILIRFIPLFQKTKNKKPNSLVKQFGSIFADFCDFFFLSVNRIFFPFIALFPEAQALKNG